MQKVFQTLCEFVFVLMVYSFGCIVNYEHANYVRVAIAFVILVLLAIVCLNWRESQTVLRRLVTTR